MDDHGCELVVIESAAFHTIVVQLESERLHEMQVTTSVRTETDDRTGVCGDFWLNQDNVHTETIIRPCT